MEDEMKLPCLVFTLDEMGLDWFSFVWRVNNATLVDASFSAVAARFSQVMSLKSRDLQRDPL
jgi:hypothetical protein